MTKPLAFGFVCFCVTLAVLIGQRLSDQAMAVVVGSVIGVLATLPMAGLMLIIVLRQRDAASASAAPVRRDYGAADEQPRMIVIQPPAYAPMAGQFPLMNQASQLNTTSWQQTRPVRDFTIVGEEEFADEDRNVVV